MLPKEHYIDGDGNPIHFEPVKGMGFPAYRIKEGHEPPDISRSEKRKINRIIDKRTS